MFLTLKKLYENCKHFLDNGLDENTPIYVTTSDNSIGGRAYVTIQSIHNGFDWESGQIRIETNEKILKYEKDRDFALEPKIKHYKFNNRNSTIISCPKCENKLRRNDKYCSICGQKIKKIE